METNKHKNQKINKEDKEKNTNKANEKKMMNTQKGLIRK
jgi:hypothetical protein